MTLHKFAGSGQHCNARTEKSTAIFTTLDFLIFHWIPFSFQILRDRSRIEQRNMNYPQSWHDFKFSFENFLEKITSIRVWKIDM